MPRFFVLTGGPGSGKTSIIESLRQAGHPCAPESGRGIIQDQQAIGGSALPWADRWSFAELMLCWEMRRIAKSWRPTGRSSSTAACRT